MHFVEALRDAEGLGKVTAVCMCHHFVGHATLPSYARIAAAAATAADLSELLESDRVGAALRADALAFGREEPTPTKL